MDEIAEADRSEIERVIESLTSAWNAGNGAAFGRSFAPDADFVNIYGMQVIGRDAVAGMHQMIFDGVYRGSRVAFSLAKARSLGTGVALAHVDARLHVPQGPMAGEMHTLATAVLVREGSGWSIASFHNTREQAPPPPRDSKIISAEH